MRESLADMMRHPIYPWHHIFLSLLAHPDDCFIAPNYDKDPISDYLSRNIPTWTDMVDEHKKKEKTSNHSSIVLLLTSSAKRAVDLNRDTQAFKGTCVTAKLFAKHLRVSGYLVSFSFQTGL